MKKITIILTVAGAMLATSAANAAVVRVGIGPVRVGVRTAPIRRAYVAPRSVIRPIPRPVIAPVVVAPAVAPAMIAPAIRPARPVARAAVVRHRRHHIWHAVNH